MGLEVTSQFIVTSSQVSLTFIADVEIFGFETKKTSTVVLL